MDVEQINNILTNSDKEVVQFSNAQILYLQDNNNNQCKTHIHSINQAYQSVQLDEVEPSSMLCIPYNNIDDTMHFSVGAP
jgi:hypothetical protein